MAKLMKAKEYAKHVGTDVRTVRRWMRNGLLKFTPPPKEHPHYARLIDSSQPRPKKKEAKSANTDKPKVKSTANVTRQVDKIPPNVKPAANVTRQAAKRPPNVASQPREKITYPRKPAFEKELQSPNVKPTANVTRQANKRPTKTASQQHEKIADQDNGQSFVAAGCFILAIIAILKGLSKKKPQQSESSHTKKPSTYMLPNSLYAGYQPNQKIASLPKPTLAEILFGKQSKK